MATAAQATKERPTSKDKETIVGFSPEELRSPFALRCAAICIDYLILVLIPSAWLFVSSLISDNPSGEIGTLIWWIAAIIFVANFLLLPMVGGQSLGKYLAGLRILDLTGHRPAFGRLLLRNTVGYLISLATAGIGFLVAAFSSKGRSLHDILFGTVVVRARKTPI